MMTPALSYPIETALLWTPPIVSETQLLTICLSCALIVLIVLLKAMPMFLALLAAAPVDCVVLALDAPGGADEVDWVGAVVRGTATATASCEQLRAGGVDPDRVEELMGRIRQLLAAGTPEERA
jgi:hypothetical protein